MTTARLPDRADGRGSQHRRSVVATTALRPYQSVTIEPPRCSAEEHFALASIPSRPCPGLVPAAQDYGLPTSEKGIAVDRGQSWSGLKIPAQPTGRNLRSNLVGNVTFSAAIS